MFDKQAWANALRTQADLQRALYEMQGAHPRQGELMIAALAELGEFLNEVKSVWVWWKRGDKSFSKHRNAAVEELADLLHFVLAMAVNLSGGDIDRRLDEDARLLIEEVDDAASREYIVSKFIHELNIASNTSAANIAVLLNSVYRLGKSFIDDLTLGELLDAYAAKAGVNVERWRQWRIKQEKLTSS